MYEPHSVLSEGRQEPISAEDAGNAAQSGEGKGGEEAAKRKEAMRIKSPDGFRLSVTCPCGVIFLAIPYLVRAGKKKTCSKKCFYEYRVQPRKVPKLRKWKHVTHLSGKANRLHGAWRGMMTRCYNQNHNSYANYGARGITVCAEWHDWDVFHDWALQSGYARGLQIDRMENASGYSPENCRWVTHKENQQNRTNVRAVIVYSPEGTKTSFGSACDVAKVLGVSSATISRNLRNKTSCRALRKAGYEISYA